MDRNVEVAVVGATGVVGRELLAALHAAGMPSDKVTALAGERSKGEEVDFGDETLEVEPTTSDGFRGRKVVLLAVPPDAARTLAQTAQAAGAWVVDVSRAFAADSGVPVVLPSVNLARLKEPFSGRIVRCPSAVGGALISTLDPVARAFGVKQVIVTALLGASSMGFRGVKALETQTASLLAGRELEDGPFPHRLAFNFIPQVGAFGGGMAGRGGSTDEELAWRLDAVQVWGPKAPAIGGTAVQSPHFFGHGLSLAFEVERDATDSAVFEALGTSPVLKRVDSPGERVYPMPLLAIGDPAILVGRVRALPTGPRWFGAFVTLDNAGRGAALNALEVVDALLARP